ncbi:MAG TPA: hypothetical protein VI756_18735 [Blastocatellia bacterium]
MSEPVFLGSETNDKMMRVVMALAREVYILQDRLAIVEKLLEEKEILSRQAIEGYKPDDSEQKLIQERRDRFIQQLLKPIIE